MRERLGEWSLGEVDHTECSGNKVSWGGAYVAQQGGGISPRGIFRSGRAVLEAARLHPGDSVPPLQLSDVTHLPRFPWPGGYSHLALL